MGAITAILRPVTRLGVNFVLRKHGAVVSSKRELDEKIGEVLARFDKRLAGRRYFFDEFSAADICLTTVLQAVEPVAGGAHQLGLGDEGLLAVCRSDGCVYAPSQLA